MLPREPRAPRARAVIAFLAGAIVLVSAQNGFAAKWRECPAPPQRTYLQRRGAVTSPFIHPGHELGIVLSETQTILTGGFSTEPGGNVVSIEFVSLFGNPVALDPIAVAAVSPNTLYFDFPDTRQILGRVLAGPVAIRGVTDGRLTAEVDPNRFVALPPAANVAQIVAGVDQDAMAALDARGALWIPIEFSGYGPTEIPMPNCPSMYIPLSAFAVAVDVRANGGGTETYPPLRAARRADVYLGDFIVFGENAYGHRQSRMSFFRMPRGFGLGICAINDAVDLVLRVAGRSRWARPGSQFAQWVKDSRPLRISLRDVSAQEDVKLELGTISFDSFGNYCNF
jgi:hypothetical protein